MRNATAGLVLLAGLMLAGLIVGGCRRRGDIVVYHATRAPNPNFIFGSQAPVMPPPDWYPRQELACRADTLDPSFFPGEVQYYREYTRDYRRSPHVDRYRSYFYGVREGVIYR